MSESRDLSINTAFLPSNLSSEGALVGWIDKKGNAQERTLEGALYKGGDALKQLKSDALQAALSKSVNGRYRSAYDIMVVAFPSIEKALATLHIGLPYSNKSSMATVLLSVLGQKPKAGKDFSAKQKDALALARAMVNIPAFEHLKPQGEVVAEAAEAEQNN